MSEEMSPVEILAYNLQWIWPNSFEKHEEKPDGTVVAYFHQYFRYWIPRFGRMHGIHYTVKITFHRHENQWRYGKISFEGHRLDKDFKDDVRQRFQTILKNWGYPPEKKNTYAG